MSLETQFVQALGGLLAATTTASIGIITPKIKAFLTTHITAKNASVAESNANVAAINVKVASNAIDSLSKIVESVVTDFNQRIVADVKTKNGFTPELAEQVKKDATAAVKSQGSQFIELIDGNTEELVSTLIEQAVAKAKGGK